MARKPTPPKDRKPAPPVVVKAATPPTKTAAPVTRPVAAAPAATPPRVTVTRPPTTTATTPKVTPTPPRPAALSLDDIKRIRDRLEAFTPETVVAAANPLTADGLVSLVADKLKAARATDAARIKALESQLTAIGKSTAADRGEVEVGLRDALDTTDTLLAEIARLRAANESLTAEVAKLKEAFDRSQVEVTDLRAAQVPTREGGHVLGAETVASLLDQFVGSFRSRLGNLEVSSGDVLLKAGFAELGKGAGFVLPSATAPASEQPVLHEIRLRLDPAR